MNFRLSNLNSKLRTRNSELQRGFSLIEIVMVIFILSIASAMTIFFLVSSMQVYTKTVNQKTLYDEGKLALERMCRDIRDANSITGSTATSITFVRAHETAPPDNTGDNAGETIIFRKNGTDLEKVKGANAYILAREVNNFTVTRDASDEIKLQLTLQLGTGENITLQTKVYPKNLLKSSTYKNFFQNWQEEISI